MTYKQSYLFALLNFPLVLSLGCLYLKYVDSVDTLLSGFYIGISTLSHFFLLSLIPFALFSLVYFFSRKQKISLFILAFSMLLGLILFTIDFLVFERFRYHLSPFVFQLVFGARPGDIFQFSNTTLWTAFVFIVTLIALEVGLLFLAKFLAKNLLKLYVGVVMSVFFFMLISSHLIYAWADGAYYRPITKIRTVYPLYYPLTAKSFLGRMGLISAKDVQTNRALYDISKAKDIQYPLQKMVFDDQKIKQKNILYIIIDSWRFDCLDSIMTPHVYQIAQKSQWFQNHFSGSNATDGGIFSLFYGINAIYWEAFTQSEVSPVFIDRLQQLNYPLGIFSSASLARPTFDRNVFSKVKALRLASKGKAAPQRDREITNEWLAFAKRHVSKSQEKPFFGFLFYDSAHGADYLPDFPLIYKPSWNEMNELSLNNELDPTPVLNRYKNAVHFIDGLIGEALEDLKARDLLKNTVIVITGDHGEEFNDNKKNYWHHGGNYTKYQIQTPMILYDADKTPQRYTHLSLHYDVTPTIMKEYLGCKNDFYFFSHGQSLYDIRKRDGFISGYSNNYAIVEPDRITKVYATGGVDITDHQLNDIPHAQLRHKSLLKAIENSNKFYKK